MTLRSAIAAAGVVSIVAIAATVQLTGGGQQTLDFHSLSGSQTDKPVEQQTEWVAGCQNQVCGFVDETEWVKNPTTCAWDVDDHKQTGSLDTSLNANASVSTTECVIADTDPIHNTHYGVAAWWSNHPRLVSLDLIAPAKTVTAKLCWSPQNRCFTLLPRYDAANRRWHTIGCILLSYDPGDPALAAIADSQGGIGVRSQVTVTVTNASSKRVGKLGVALSVLGGYIPSLDCDGHPYVIDYPFRWAT